MVSFFLDFVVGVVVCRREGLGLSASFFWKYDGHLFGEIMEAFDVALLLCWCESRLRLRDTFLGRSVRATGAM